MLAARGSLLLLMDADGATRVADLAKLEADLRKVCCTAGTHPSCLCCCLACTAGTGRLNCPSGLHDEHEPGIRPELCILVKRGPRIVPSWALVFVPLLGLQTCVHGISAIKHVV